MNEKLITQVKKYVNMLLGPLEGHYYHQYEHALEVMDRVCDLGNKEGLSENELEILTLAALFHDTGFAIQYDDNEYIGASIAKNYLKSVLYPEDKILIVQNLIISTIYSRNPENILENIMRDADTDNLGRDDFFDKGEKLKKEIETIKKIKILDPDWLHYSLEFLKNHSFVTKTEIKERQPKKEENIKKLEEIVSKPHLTSL